MRTRLTSYDVKNIAENIFNGNLRLHEANNNIAYKNDYSEKIILKNETTDEQEEKDLAQYLNIHFYTWKNRVVETSELGIEERLTPFDYWVQSMNVSFDSAFALLEIVDEEVQVSQDIDNAIKSAKITFLIQTDKVSNLDYYITKIRNELLGKVQTIQNAYGKLLKAYINVGTLIYEGEPQTIQFGSCIQCSCSFEISYMADALTNEDIKVFFSLDGEEYEQMPITKSTYQLICVGNAEPTVERPDLTGTVNTTTSWVKTYSYFDFNTSFNKKLNQIFWQTAAYKIDNVLSSVKEVNTPIYVKIQMDNYEYIYKDVIVQMEKIVTNSDFTISSLTLKTYGKLN